jgi:hypothetical protein
MSVLAASVLALDAFLALAARPECGARAAIDPHRMQAIAEQESGLDPLVIGVNADRIRGLPADTLRSASVEEATAKAASLIARGRSVDLGLMGINAGNLAKDGLTLTTAFDACASIAASYRHLSGDFEAAAWELAHRRYNCGRFTCGEGYAASIQARISRVMQTAPIASAPAAMRVDTVIRGPIPPTIPERRSVILVDALHPGSRPSSLPGGPLGAFSQTYKEATR